MENDVITIPRNTLDSTLVESAMIAGISSSMTTRERINFALAFSAAAMGAIDEVLKQATRSQAARKAAQARHAATPALQDAQMAMAAQGQQTAVTGAAPAFPQPPHPQMGQGLPTGPAPLPPNINVPTVKRKRRTKAEILAAATVQPSAAEAAHYAAQAAAAQGANPGAHLNPPGGFVSMPPVAPMGISPQMPQGPMPAPLAPQVAPPFTAGPAPTQMGPVFGSPFGGAAPTQQQ